jgi:hypothetical protein
LTSFLLLAPTGVFPRLRLVYNPLKDEHKTGANCVDCHWSYCSLSEKYLRKDSSQLVQRSSFLEL